MAIEILFLMFLVKCCKQEIIYLNDSEISLSENESDFSLLNNKIILFY